MTPQRTLILTLLFPLAVACVGEHNPPAPGGGGSDTADPGDSGVNDLTGTDTNQIISLPDVAFNYANVTLPAHFNTAAVRGMDNTPANNPTTDHGATLGRVLFHDRQLSANGTVACASCHAADSAFADPRQFSIGFEGGATGRNSMSLVNARFYRNGRFFWDERAATLEDQVLMPIQDATEMGLTLEQLVLRVNQQDMYAALFTSAFGDAEVTTQRISRALAQFVRAKVSYRSRFDDGLAATNNVIANFPNFDDAENQGKALFFGRARCASCHLANPPGGPGGAPPTNAAVFYVNVATSNGLPDDDLGVGAVTNNPRDNNRFKSPSLRNTALTGPYMHDGRFSTLRQVVDHYDSGVQNTPNLDPRLRGQNGQPMRLNLTAAEKNALIAFLNTLSDDDFFSDPKFSDPFVR